LYFVVAQEDSMSMGMIAAVVLNVLINNMAVTIYGIEWNCNDGISD
jgi:hypothetical protein